MEEGNKKLSVGGTTPITLNSTIDLGLSSEAKADRWVKMIDKVKEDAVVVYTDGSMSEEGRVGGGRREVWVLGN